MVLPRRQGVTMAKSKSARRVRFLLSKGSPLTGAERSTLRSELRSGAVIIKEKKRVGRVTVRRGK